MDCLRKAGIDRVYPQIEIIDFPSRVVGLDCFGEQSASEAAIPE